MTDLIAAFLVALVALVGYHIATYGRRGRRWGLTNGAEHSAISHQRSPKPG